MGAVDAARGRTHTSSVTAAGSTGSGQMGQGFLFAGWTERQRSRVTAGASRRDLKHRRTGAHEHWILPDQGARCTSDGPVGDEVSGQLDAFASTGTCGARPLRLCPR